jgi:sterol desaturase/sphingolipid hydroxylase (fatty acid hydroxylase superfamily)
VGVRLFLPVSRVLPVIIDLQKFSLVIQICIAVILLDFLWYWSHRISHIIPLFWEFHKNHHSSIEMTALSSVRTNFFQVQINLFFVAILFNFFTFNISVLEIVMLIFSAQGAFVHSNLNLGGSFLSKIFATPNFHRWHHAEDNLLPHGQNFGVIFSFWDSWLNSEYISNLQPTTLGFKNINTYPSNWISRLFHPFPAYFKIIFDKN